MQPLLSQRRFRQFVFAAVMAITVASGMADEPPKKPLTLAQMLLLDYEVKKNDEKANKLFLDGKYDEAIVTFKKSLETRRLMYPVEKFPKGHDYLAIGLSNMGVGLAAIGRYAEALPYLEEALRMRRGLYPVADYPKGHENLLISLHNYGGSLIHADRMVDAKPIMEEALAMARRLFPPEKHPKGQDSLIRAIVGLGTVLESLGRFDESLPLLEEGLALARRLPQAKGEGTPRLFTQALHQLTGALTERGEFDRALKLNGELLDIARRDFPRDKYPKGHPMLSGAINMRGSLLQRMDRALEGVPLLFEALAMREAQFPKERFPRGHPDLAFSYHNLGLGLEHAGRLDESLENFEKALRMFEQLYPKSEYPNGHNDLISVRVHLGNIYASMKRNADSVQARRDTLAMAERLFPKAKYPDGHPTLMKALQYLAIGLQTADRHDEAIPIAERAVAMAESLFPPARFPRGHTDLADVLNNLGVLYSLTNQGERALPLLKRCVAIYETFYSPSQSKIGALNLDLTRLNLATALAVRGPDPRVMPLFESTLANMQRRSELLALSSSDSEAIDALQYIPQARNLLLSVTRARPETTEQTYRMLWEIKSLATRTGETRHRSRRLMIGQSTELQRQWRELLDQRRELGRALIADWKHPTQRDTYVQRLADDVRARERDIHAKIPALAQSAAKQTATTADLRRTIPAGSALIDLVAYAYQLGRTQEWRYAAFVSTRENQTVRVELGDFTELNRHVADWLSDIDANRPSEASRRLREKLWEPVAKVLPGDTHTIWIAPDGDLVRIPWAALPGPNDTVLLEKYAIGIVPHGPFLAERLIHAAPPADQGEFVMIGDVDYGSDPAAPRPPFSALPGTAEELDRLKKLTSLPTRTLRGADASVARLEQELAQCRFAHLATHGFFDRDRLNADRARRKEAQRTWSFNAGPTAGRTAIDQRHPLAYCGLALAGANAGPAGILTGESIIGLPLDGLSLCVLSACESGLGDAIDGEGVFGLPRAFHLAGCPNVVASLWKVNDAATAALMTKFYHEMWVNRQSPLAALREAQLTIYRHPDLIPDLAGERGAPRIKDALAVNSSAALNPQSPKRAATKQWAAFVLSGVGK